MKINDAISGTFSKLAFEGRIIRIDGGLISVVVTKPHHRFLPVGPCLVDGKFIQALSFHVKDTNVTIN